MVLSILETYVDIYIRSFITATDTTLQHLIDKINPDINHIHDQTDNVKAQYFSERVILAAGNIEVDAVNESILEQDLYQR
jgi:hypothetical protein